jgi:hypothetical protein
MDKGNRADEKDSGEKAGSPVSELAAEGEDAEDSQDPYGRRSPPASHHRVSEELQRKGRGETAGTRDLGIARLEEPAPSLHEIPRRFDRRANVVVDVSGDRGEIPSDRESRKNDKGRGEGGRPQAPARAGRGLSRRLQEGGRDGDDLESDPEPEGSGLVIPSPRKLEDGQAARSQKRGRDGGERALVYFGRSLTIFRVACPRFAFSTFVETAFSEMRRT